MKFLLLFLLSILGTSDPKQPVTEERLNELLKNLTVELKDEVQRVVTSSESQSLSILQQEIKNRQQEEEQANINRFSALQEMIKGLSSTTPTKENPVVTAETNPTLYIIPIFLKMMRCGNCFSCRRGEVCFYYVFIYVLPLIINGGDVKPNGSGGGGIQSQAGVNPLGGTNSTNNALLQTLMNSMTGQRAPQGLFPNQQAAASQSGSSLIQSLFNFMFNDKLGAQDSKCCPPCPPPYGPCPPPCPPCPEPCPPCPPTYGPCPPPCPPPCPEPCPKPCPPTYGPCPPSYGPLPEPTESREYGTNYGLRN